MKEGSAKKIAQINLDYDNEIAAILTKEKEWKDVHGTFLFLQLFLIYIRGQSLPFDIWVHQGCMNLHGLFLSQFAALNVFPLFFLGKYGGDLIVIV